MRSIGGHLTVLAATVVAFGVTVAPASASSGWPSGQGEGRDASGPAAFKTTGTVPPCQDDAFRFIGGHWTKVVRWRFQSKSTPSGLNVSGVESVLVKSFNNITGAHNDCGRADKVSAENSYEGRTERSANISKRARCTASDGRNVVAFGALPQGILAATCTRHIGNQIVEADIRISSRYAWALSSATCSNQELLEPTITHEVGHVYGLGHVGERQHPLLTMSTRSDGPCSNAASTLGLGDMLGLEELY